MAAYIHTHAEFQENRLKKLEDNDLKQYKMADIRKKLF